MVVNLARPLKHKHHEIMGNVAVDLVNSYLQNPSQIKYDVALAKVTEIRSIVVSKLQTQVITLNPQAWGDFNLNRNN